MKSSYNFYFLILLCLIFSCKSKQTNEEENIQTLSVIQKSLANQIKSSDFFSSVKYVSLETNQDLLLDNIIKIAHLDNCLYVADKFAVYKFDEDGILLGEINKTGQGPGEYLSVSDFEIADNETIWILSRNDKNLYNYTWDGELKKSLKLNYWAAKIHLIPPDKMCLYTGNEMDEANQNQIKIIDTNTNTTIRNLMRIDENKAKFLHVNSINHFSENPDHNRLYFFNLFDDKIYWLTNDTVFPVFNVDIYNKNIPLSFFRENYTDIQDFFQSLFMRDYAYGTALFVEYKDKYLYSYYYDKECHFSIISKKNNESIIDFKTIAEDINLFGFPIHLVDFSPFIQKNNEIIFQLIPSDVIEYAKNNLDAEKVNEIMQIIKYKSDDQNPVLLIGTLKLNAE